MPALLFQLPGDSEGHSSPPALSVPCRVELHFQSLGWIISACIFLKIGFFFFASFFCLPVCLRMASVLLKDIFLSALSVYFPQLWSCSDPSSQSSCQACLHSYLWCMCFWISTYFVLLKQNSVLKRGRCWKDGSTVRSTGCSSRSPGFNAQHPQDRSQLFVVYQTAGSRTFDTSQTYMQREYSA